jgi:hypothetical protein
MYHKVLSLIPVLFLIITNQLISQNNFYAYHTKVSKYADLIVVIGGGRQLEFTRRTQYLPKWVTPEGSFMVDDFYPGRDMDYNLEYNYVRLIEESPEKIIVHWRYMPDLDEIKRANANLDPTSIKGFTSVVHELFTIHPDGRVKRLVKDARGSTFETWIKDKYADQQTLKLTDSGIEYGSVFWGDKRGELLVTKSGNPIITTTNLVKPILSWTFDEGSEGIPFEVEEEEAWEFANTVFESVTEEFSPVQGHMAVFKKGVSGTALGFDGYYTGVSFNEKPELNNDRCLLQ